MIHLGKILSTVTVKRLELCLKKKKWHKPQHGEAQNKLGDDQG
jgi:hypothetical protein